MWHSWHAICRGEPPSPAGKSTLAPADSRVRTSSVRPSWHALKVNQQRPPRHPSVTQPIHSRLDCPAALTRWGVTAAVAAGFGWEWGGMIPSTSCPRTVKETGHTLATQTDTQSEPVGSYPETDVRCHNTEV